MNAFICCLFLLVEYYCIASIFHCYCNLGIVERAFLLLYFSLLYNEHCLFIAYLVFLDIDVV